MIDLIGIKNSGERNIVQLSGGMGNQLFQINFAHYLNWRFGENIFVMKPRLRKGLPHTHLSFFDKNYTCNHCKYIIHEGNHYINEFFNPWSNSGAFRVKKLRKFADYRDYPYLRPENIILGAKKDVFVGYFQNHAFVSPVEAVMRQEIMSELDRRTKEFARFKTEEDIEIVHVRQGDTKSPRNMKRVGVLGNDYYKSLLGRSTDLRSRVVVTDDVQGTLSVLRGIPVDMIYGPRDLDSWEALALMASARRLFVANSTFSWWGGFLALGKKAEVIIPRPFFASKDLETNGAFKFPGFVEKPSSFLN